MAEKCQETIRGFFGRPGGCAVDSKRSRRSAQSRHAGENQRGREFDSLVEATVVTRHDYTSVTFA
jgi:hypothetical protein